MGGTPILCGDGPSFWATAKANRALQSKGVTHYQNGDNLGDEIDDDSCMPTVTDVSHHFLLADIYIFCCCLRRACLRAYTRYSNKTSVVYRYHQRRHHDTQKLSAMAALVFY